VFPILIIKTAALGDVLRTTSILPGLHEAHPTSEITWLVAQGAEDLVRLQPLVDRVVTVDLDSPGCLERVGADLGHRRWQWVISLDEEESLCRLASSLEAEKLTGACLETDGGEHAGYTEDSAAWFDMGLTSRFGKQEADRLKRENTLSHAAIFAHMLGIPDGQPSLRIPVEAFDASQLWGTRKGLDGSVTVIGINTGAGSRWESKGLDEQRTIELIGFLHRELEGDVKFVLLGGPAEKERNLSIMRGLPEAYPEAIVLDAGTDNSQLDFAAFVDRCDLLITSDTLAMHIAIARNIPLVAFFAPTSGAEIDLYGLGEKVLSTAPDYCSYRPDADNETLTVERLGRAALRTLP
jgi:heptosyltransferase-2